ncbi:hypothetical protein SDJN03_05347, partial [Cucurbita argyrosperma subsp. sororia]
MTVPSNCSQSNLQPTGAGDDEAAARTYLSRKKAKRPLMASSSDLESHRSTTGATVCNLSPSQTARITQQFDHSLIAWVFGQDIRPRQLAGRLRRHLHLTQDVEVFELGLGYFVLKFSETDYLALEDLPWSIPNLCIYAFRWTPDFKPSEAINSSVDVWIRLHELSIEYYDEEILRQIAATIGGVLVKFDPVTKNRRKCKFARICIRINLCDPLPSMIKLGRIQQKIEYEGLDLLCPNCRLVHDLKQNCLNSGNPSGSSGLDTLGDRPTHHHRTRPLLELGSSSSSKQPLIPSVSSPASACGSRFQVLENDLLLDECEKASPSIRISSPHVHVKDKAAAKPKELCGDPVRSLPKLPKKPSTKTTKAPELELVAPAVVEHQFKPAKTSNPTLIADHNNQPCLVPKATLDFISAVIRRSMKEKEMPDIPSKEIIVDGCPIVHTINTKKIRSFKMNLSALQTNSIPNRNHYTMDTLPTARCVDEDGDGSKTVSGSESCSKKMLCWKFHGTDNANLMQALKDLIQLHEPSIVLIFGTKISGAEAEHVVRELSFCGSYCRKPDGYNGGVWLLLSRQDVQIEVDSYSPQQVSASVYFGSNTNRPAFSPPNVDTETSSGPWGSTFFYTSTNWMSSVAY